MGNFVYEDGSLKFIITDDGRLVPKTGGSFEYEYFITDHLGNTRVVVKDSSGVAVVQQESHYYPFGLGLSGMSYQNPLQQSVNKYLYNGKEYIDDLDLNLYSYGARDYDPVLGRFHVIDNYSEVYYSLTPYQYTDNSPINFVDHNGDYIMMYDNNGVGFWYENGKAYWAEKDKNGNTVRGKEYKEAGKNDAIKQTVSDLNKISDNGMGRRFVSDLVSSERETGITFNSNLKAKDMGFYYETTKEIKYNTYDLYLDDGVDASKSHINLGHEIAHAWADQFAKDYSLREPGKYSYKSIGSNKVTKGTIRMKAERFAVRFANHLRASEGSTDMRYNYMGKDLFGWWPKLRGADYFERYPLPDSYMHIKPLAKRISVKQLPMKLSPKGTK